MGTSIPPEQAPEIAFSDLTAETSFSSTERAKTLNLISPEVEGNFRIFRSI
jgi:hypothetical protein